MTSAKYQFNKFLHIRSTPPAAVKERVRPWSTEVDPRSPLVAVLVTKTLTFLPGRLFPSFLSTWDCVQEEWIAHTAGSCTTVPGKGTLGASGLKTESGGTTCTVQGGPKRFNGVNDHLKSVGTDQATDAIRIMRIGLFPSHRCESDYLYK